MKASYRVRADLSVEVEGESQKDLFRALAQAAEVFGEEKCGACQQGRIVPQCRTRQKFTFYEWLCLHCGATLSLGQLKDGDALYPIRRLDAKGKPDHEHGQPGKHRGWTRWRGEGSEMEVEPQRPRDTEKKEPAPTAVKPAGHRDGPITEDEWAALKTALTKSGIGTGTFLRWCGHALPRQIPHAEYAGLLRAAQQPPADLKAQAAIPLNGPR